MTKIEKVRQYMEISSTGDKMAAMMRQFVGQLIPAISKMGGLDEKESAELMSQIDAQLLLSMPGFVSACAQALADVWTDEIADYQLEQCQHPLAKATRDVQPVFEEKARQIAEAWATQLMSQVQLED
jgi:hypothetical protein